MCEQKKKRTLEIERKDSKRISIQAQSNDELTQHNYSLNQNLSFFEPIDEHKNIASTRCSKNKNI